MASSTENNKQTAFSDHLSSLSKENPTKSHAIEIPQISMPKGGGAIKGIDEKFQVNPSNGTASFSIPLPLSPNRNGFTPSLSVSYNSGAGNSVLGIGWSLDVPSIQRKSDKKLPRYRDSPEEDTFMLAGAEDLVPEMEFKQNRWERVQLSPEESGGYAVQRYRPRIEGGYSRIERIYREDHGMYWRVTTRDNVTTIFGRSDNCRIADPTDKTRIFQWLPELSFDDKGSVVVYHYKAEDASGMGNGEGLALHVFDANRLGENGQLRFANRYLKRVLYGNSSAFYPDDAIGVSPYDPPLPGNDTSWHFELVLDYGEHHPDEPTPIENTAWLTRPDPFSTYRAGFEIRTCRLLKRALMFHRFPTLNADRPTLVRSMDFGHKISDSLNAKRETELEFLARITQVGYTWLPTENRYSKKSLPPLEFSYQPLAWNQDVQRVGEEELMNTPVGLSANYQWVDLYNEGINGVLTEQAGGWFYKHNLGDVSINDQGLGGSDGKLRFEPAKLVLNKPSYLGISAGVLQLQDLESRGEKQWVVNSDGIQGYFEMTDDEAWLPFRSFLKTANIDLKDPNIRLLDLNGDGMPEIVMTEELAIVWFPNDGKLGYDSPELAMKPFDEELGPAILFADAAQSIFLADMSGDGLTDIVRVRNGEVCYWANLGYGRFGRKVTMENPPLFDHQDAFNPALIQLADLSGTGATDIVYLGQNRFRAWLNLSGNRWGTPQEIEPFFPLEQPNKLTVTDLLGNGTGCLVWSSELPSHASSPMRYIDLMGGKKPHIMTSYHNNAGKRVTTEYKSSTFFYLKDKLAGKPWATKLPFPVQVVCKSIIEDQVSGLRFASKYSYHHGCFDHAEREFRGFGRVEQTDTESFLEINSAGAANGVRPEFHQPPIMNKTWFHTGAFLNPQKVLSQFEREYWYNDPGLASLGIHPIESPLPDAKLSIGGHIPEAERPGILADLSIEDWQEAFRACKGMILRQETFALDAPAFEPSSDELKKQATPFTVATHNCGIQLLQPRIANHFGVFTVKESEALTYHYERHHEDPRVAHSLNLEHDQYGNVLKSVSVVYPRLQNEPELSTLGIDNPKQRTCLEKAQNDQKKVHILFTQNQFTEDTLQAEALFRLPVLCQSQTFELNGFAKNGWLINGKLHLFQLSDFENVSSLLERPYQQIEPNGLGKEKRLIEQARTLFLADDLKSPLPLGRAGKWGLPFEAYQLAYTPGLLAAVFQSNALADNTLPIAIMELDLDEARFEKIDGNRWIRSGRITFLSNGEMLGDAKARFFSPIAFTDPFDASLLVEHDPHHLAIVRTEDAVGNKTAVTTFDYRSLSPVGIQDANGDRTAALTDELGLPKAMAVMGKGNEADLLDGLSGHDTEAETLLRQAFWQEIEKPETDSAALHDIAKSLLGKSSARFVYDFDRTPMAVASITREEHHRILEIENRLDELRLQIGVEYTDGLGKVAMKKVQAEPGTAKKMELLPDGNPVFSEVNTGARLRWVGNGRTVFNNKGNPVLQYEPYFAASAGYEDAPALVEQGFSTKLTYDPLGRAIRTDLPDGSFSRVEFNAWKQKSFDPNDTVKDSRWYADRFHRRIDAQLLAAGKDPVREQQAAQRTAAHYGTPSDVYLDSLGRPVLGADHNGFDDEGKPVLSYTRAELDVEGNVRGIFDARFNRVMAWAYDMLGHRIFQESMDAGKRWMFNNALGNPVKSWDQRRHLFSFSYDVLHRPVAKQVQGGDGPTPLNHTYERIFYGETLPNAEALRLRGKPVLSFDTSGHSAVNAFDFKGNPLETSRHLLASRSATPDWSGNNPATNLALNLLDSERFIARTRYDALNRPVQQTAPKSDRIGARFNIQQMVYNPAGFLEKTHVWLQAPNAPDGLLDPATANLNPVRNIDYNEKGQRMRIAYGNGTSTRYDYDSENFRLLRLRTTKEGGGLLQDLRYTYDPTGNITHLGDAAVPTVFFNNFMVEAVQTYEYDALYRLTTATGREHIGQLQHGASDNWNDRSFLQKHHPNDALALRPYTQRYEYDAVGNILKMKHLADNGNWTRRYEFELDNNRLRRTWMRDADAPAPGDDAYTYLHHPEHGFLTALPHLSSMQWNFAEQLQASSTQVAANPESTRYQYDAAGQRSRKSQHSNGGQLRYERLYFGGFELYREYGGGQMRLERETLHLMDGEHRIALVEIRSLGNDDTEQTLVRYQHGNHLGSASLETDETGRVLSYEEYHPYGTTAVQATNASIRATAKRYRYTGMERDEETGLAYHSARYYLPWLGRWASADPIGIGGGINLYEYANSSPYNFGDSSGNLPDWMNKGLTSAKQTAQNFSKTTPGKIILGVGDGQRELMKEAFQMATTTPLTVAIQTTVAVRKEKDESEKKKIILSAVSGVLPTTLVGDAVGAFVAAKTRKKPASTATALFESVDAGIKHVPFSKPAEDLDKTHQAFNRGDLREAVKHATVGGAHYAKEVIETTLAIEGAIKSVGVEGLSTSKGSSGSTLNVPESVTKSLASDQSLAPLKAESLGGRRIFIVGPEGASSTRAIRIRGNLITYDTLAPAGQGKVRADMKIIANQFGGRGNPVSLMGDWMSGTHGNPMGQFGGSLSEPRFFTRERGFGKYYGWQVRDATKVPLSGLDLSRPTVLNWCYSSSCKF